MALVLSTLQEINFREIPHPSLKICVIIPVKDEADHISTALNALRNQVNNLGTKIPHEWYEVLILANNCSDDTYEICKNYQNAHTLFNLSVENVNFAPNLANVGTVRRLLMDAAYDRLMSVTGTKGVIISTDGDSEVDKQWIFQIMNEIDNGADVVGGRIFSKDTPSLARTHHLRDVTYRFLKARLECEIDPCPINPWPRHHQCFGASLAVTCAMYERAGRLPMLPFLEDEAFRQAANRIDAKIRHSPKVIVHTSSRLIGKVEVGFSGQLKEWESMSINDQQQMEESFESAKHQFILKKQVRQAWNALKHDGLSPNLMRLVSNEIGINEEQLLSLLCENVYFESLWEKIHKHWVLARPNSITMQPVAEVISDFRQYFALTNKFISS